VRGVKKLVEGVLQGRVLYTREELCDMGIEVSRDSELPMIQHFYARGETHYYCVSPEPLSGEVRELVLFIASQGKYVDDIIAYYVFLKFGGPTEFGSPWAFLAEMVASRYGVEPDKEYSTRDITIKKYGSMYVVKKQYQCRLDRYGRRVTSLCTLYEDTSDLRYAITLADSLDSESIEDIAREMEN